MNESEQRKLETKHQHEAFIRAHGGDASKKLKEKKIEETISTVLNLESIFHTEKEKETNKKQICGYCNLLEDLAFSLLRLVIVEKLYCDEELENDYLISKASTLLTVLTGYPVNLAFKMTTIVFNDRGEELINGI